MSFLVATPSDGQVVPYTDSDPPAPSAPDGAQLGNNMNHIASLSTSTQATYDLLRQATFWHQDDLQRGEYVDLAEAQADNPSPAVNSVFYNEDTATWWLYSGGSWSDTSQAKTNVPAGRSAIDPVTGWPIAGTTYATLHCHDGNKYNPGTYTFANSSSGTMSGGTLELNSGVTGQVQLQFSGELVNPSLRRAGDVGIWNASFLERNANFSCIRFLNWTRSVNETNYYRPRYPNGIYRRFSNVFYDPVPSHDDMRDACETIGCDAWINIPHTATQAHIDDIVTAWTGFANVLYVEHSNEVWNSQFPANNYAEAKALEEPYVSNGGGQFQNAYGAWHADRTDEIGEQFLDSIPTCVPVLGQQFAVIATTINGVPRGVRWPHPFIKAYAIAPYYSRSTLGPPSDITLAELNTMTGAEVADRAYLDVEARIVPLLQQWKDLCESRGVRLLGYESGLSMLHNDSSIQDKLDESAHDDRHGFHYANYYDRLFEFMPDLINVYRLSGNDRFGCNLVELDRPITGKYPAVQTLATEVNS